MLITSESGDFDSSRKQSTQTLRTQDNLEIFLRVKEAPVDFEDPADTLATAFPTPTSATTASLTPAMGLSYNVYLNSPKIYGCKNCKAHLSNHEDIISRNFRGQHGKAYLFSSVVNVVAGEASERNMTTGKHIVRDISCRECGDTVGWKYDKAFEASEKYKEGKFILEAELLCLCTNKENWEGEMGKGLGDD